MTPDYGGTPAPVSPGLNAAIDAAVKAVPAGKTGAVSAAVTLKGTEVSVGYKFRPSWSVGAWAAKEWRGRSEAGVRLTGSW